MLVRAGKQPDFLGLAEGEGSGEHEDCEQQAVPLLLPPERGGLRHRHRAELLQDDEADGGGSQGEGGPDQQEGVERNAALAELPVVHHHQGQQHGAGFF